MQLPVVEVAAESFHFLWRHWRVLVDRAAVPVAVVVLVGLLEYLSVGGAGSLPSPDAGEDGAETRFLSLTYFAVSLPFLVGWYRLVVLGPGGIAGRSSLSFTRLEGRFFLWMALLALVTAVPLIVSGAVALPFITGTLGVGQVPPMLMLASLFLAILLILVLLRLSLIFPAISADEPASFARAWEMTKGNSFRLLAVMALVHLPALVFAAVIQALTAGLGLPFSLDLFVNVSVSFALTALGATVFGQAYVRLR